MSKDKEIALKRLNNKKDKVISSEEMKEGFDGHGYYKTEHKECKHFKSTHGIGCCDILGECNIDKCPIDTEHKEKPYTTKAQENIKCSVRHKEKILNKHSKITHKEGKQEERKCEIWDKVCPVCGGDTAIRNPTGKCDHLYYPDNVKQEVKEGDIEKIFVKDEMEKWESELFEALSMLIGELISNNLITSEEKYSMIFEYGQNINKCVISEYKSSLINNIKGRLEDLKVNPKDETMWENDNYDYEIEFDRGIDEAIKILEDM